MSNPRKRLKNQILTTIVVLLSVIAIASVVTGVKLFAEDTGKVESVGVQSGTADQSNKNTGYAFIAAAIAFGLGALGAGIGIGNVGAAAMGAIAEKPEIAGQALIFVALAEGLVIFGFITALMILGKV